MNQTVGFWNGGSSSTGEHLSGYVDQIRKDSLSEFLKLGKSNSKGWARGFSALLLQIDSGLRILAPGKLHSREFEILQSALSATGVLANKPLTEFINCELHQCKSLAEWSFLKRLTRRLFMTDYQKTTLADWFWIQKMSSSRRYRWVPPWLCFQERMLGQLRSHPTEVVESASVNWKKQVWKGKALQEPLGSLQILTEISPQPCWDILSCWSLRFSEKVGSKE